MQTFLPYPDFQKSAQCLDMRRLGKQRVEAWQIYKALTEENYGWKNHPAILMWKGYKIALLQYGVFICEEWVKRGYKDTLKEKFKTALYTELYPLVKLKTNWLLTTVLQRPNWFGNEQFHASHRSNLLKKKPEWYSQFGWEEPNNLPYFWPSKEIK